MKLARKVFQNRLCPVLLLLCCTFAKAVTAVDEKSRSSAPPPNAKAEEVINFAIIDHRGRFHELRRADGKVIVLFFTGNGSSIARQSIWKLRLLQQRYLERGVIVWMVNSNPEDDRSRLVQEAEGSHSDPLPILKDDTQGVARLLGVKSTGEAIAIGARDWRIFY